MWVSSVTWWDFHEHVFFRLYALQEKREAKAEMMRWLEEQAVDHETGQQLFRPRTGRLPYKDRSQGFSNIYERLHQLQ